jgi:hypothetical protein
LWGENGVNSKKHIIELYLMIGSEVPPKTNIARSENMEVAVGPSMNHPIESCGLPSVAQNLRPLVGG